MQYKKGNIAVGKVLRVGNKFAIIEMLDGSNFLIYRNEISDFHKHRPTEILSKNEIINFVVLSYDPIKKQGIGSFKLNHPNFMYAPFVYKLKETKNGFKNLLQFTLSSLKSSKDE